MNNPKTLGSIPWWGRVKYSFLSLRVNSCADLFVLDPTPPPPPLVRMVCTQICVQVKDPKFHVGKIPIWTIKLLFFKIPKGIQWWRHRWTDNWLLMPTKPRRSYQGDGGDNQTSSSVSS